MHRNLAITAPTIGSVSETFILRHMRDLLPGGTVVVAGSEEGIGLDEGIPRLLLGRNQEPRRPGSLLQFLRKHDVGVVMGEYLTWSHQWLDTVRSAGCRYFVHGHGYDVSRALRNHEWLARYLDYNRADGVIAVSYASRNRLIAIGIRADAIHVVPCGVDVPTEPPVRPPRELVKCVAVGRMVGKKAPLTTLEAFRRAAGRCDRLRLDFIGGGPLLREAEEYVRRNDLAGIVNLLGPRSHAAVSAAMRDADIFVQHSITDPITGDEEGLPVSILEAMASGLPVVSTRHAGIPEAVLENVTGLLVDEGDAAAMGEHLLTLAADDAARAQLGAAGWRRAADLFSWERERALLSEILGLGLLAREVSSAPVAAVVEPAKPLITVVVPAYNRASTLERCLASVRAQTYPHWEVVVVDDGSADTTRDVVEGLAANERRIRLAVHRERQGAQAARNTGIRAARGEWIAFLDSDDEFLPHSLESRLQRAIEERTDVVHSACRVRQPDGTVEAYHVPRLSGRIYHELLRHEGPVFPALLVSRAALDAIGLLDEQILAFQEWDTCIRLARRYEFSFEPRPTFVYDCRGDDAMSKDFLRNGRAYEQVLKKHFASILRHGGPAALAHHHCQAERWYEMAGAHELARRSRRRARFWTGLRRAAVWSKLRVVLRAAVNAW
jgi:colanic acid/amylovoran biosynthesis glycosyltransferase